MPYQEKFVSVAGYDALYESTLRKEIIILELRTNAAGVTSLFTMIEGQEVLATSIPEFVLARSDCISLKLTHKVQIRWNGDVTYALLEEIFSRKVNDLPTAHIRLRLLIDDDEFQTSDHISFTEAMFELHDITEAIAQWQLVTCYDCKYSRPAFLWPTSDRDEMRCFRDSPEEFQKILDLHKFASNKVLHGGVYFVGAFHKCAAWEQM